MFEKEIKFIYDFSLNRIKRMQGDITFEKLSNSGMHPAIIKYISAEIDYLVFEDRRRLTEKSVFDYARCQLDKSFRDVADNIRNSEILSLEYLKNILLHAVSFNINYIFQPGNALVRFIFADSESQSKREIRHIINYLYYYSYIADIIRVYSDKKKIEIIFRKDFEDLVKRIFHEVAAGGKESLIQNAVWSFADFFAIGQSAKTAVPLSGVKLFLDEFDFEHESENISSVIASGKTLSDIFELKNIITSAVTERPQYEGAKIISSAAELKKVNENTISLEGDENDDFVYPAEKPENSNEIVDDK
jgi:hypothetical protein